jgi:hypothetical protein
LHATKRIIYKILWQSQGVPKLSVLTPLIAAEYALNAIKKN